MTYTNGHNPNRDDGAGREERESERTQQCGKRVGRWWCLHDRGHDGECGGPPELAADIARNIAESYSPFPGEDG